MMIKSMTGYGKAVAELSEGKLTIEIRSVNGKAADISIKSNLLPKDRELDVRKRMADMLRRGTIDMFITLEANASEGRKSFNMDLARDYFKQVLELTSGSGCPDLSSDRQAAAIVASAVLKMPDIFDSRKQEIINEENWPLVEKAVEEALARIDEYRSVEGEALYRDVTSRIATILSLYDEIETYETERIAAARERIVKAAEETATRLDPERFEQEMVYYLEKLDINEEKVRLRQHCRYFMETIETDPFPGKKLGFIIQEMGREINTTGSKANHASIQKCVVRMKDELEKIREQSMNIL